MSEFATKVQLIKICDDHDLESNTVSGTIIEEDWQHHGTDFAAAAECYGSQRKVHDKYS